MNENTIVVIGFIGLPIKDNTIKNPYYKMTEEYPFKRQKVKKLKSGNRFRRK